LIAATVPRYRMRRTSARPPTMIRRLGRRRYLGPPGPIRRGRQCDGDPGGQVPASAMRAHDVTGPTPGTGVRLGEALALHWTDLDSETREIRVSRALSAGEVEMPKSGHGRTIDMSQQLGRMPGPAPDNPENGEAEARMGRDTPMSILHPGGDTFRLRQRREGLQADPRDSQAAPALHAPLPPAHLCPPTAPTWGEPSVCPATARARLDPAHGGHLRAVAPHGEQGSRGPTGRPGW